MALRTTELDSKKARMPKPFAERPIGRRRLQGAKAQAFLPTDTWDD